MKKKKFSKRGYNLVIFDCDSTLTKIEGIDLLAKIKGKEKKVQLLTKQAMEGKISLDEVFPKRLNLVKPRKKDLIWLGDQYIKYQVKDAKKTIKELKKRGKKVYVITHGYREAVEIFASNLGVPKKNIFAVDLKFDRNGNYLGYNEKNPLVRRGGKKKVVKNLAKKGKTIFVGDGVTDLEVKGIVDLFVGFGGVVVRPIVQAKADIFINTETLLPIVVLSCGLRL